MVAFDANVLSATVNIPIVDDVLPESDKTFSVTMSDPSDPDSTIVTPDTVEITIRENGRGIINICRIIGTGVVMITKWIITFTPHPEL